MLLAPLDHYISLYLQIYICIEISGLIKMCSYYVRFLKIASWAPPQGFPEQKIWGGGQKPAFPTSPQVIRCYLQEADLHSLSTEQKKSDFSAFLLFLENRKHKFRGKTLRKVVIQELVLI